MGVYVGTEMWLSGGGTWPQRCTALQHSRHQPLRAAEAKRWRSVRLLEENVTYDAKC